MERNRSGRRAGRNRHLARIAIDGVIESKARFTGDRKTDNRRLGWIGGHGRNDGRRLEPFHVRLKRSACSKDARVSDDVIHPHRSLGLRV